MKKQKLFIIATILVTLFIFGNSMLSAASSGKGSDILADAIEKTITFMGRSFSHKNIVVFVRKTAHILEFTLHGFLLMGCFSKKLRDRIIYVLFFGLLTACTDEFIQLFSKGRASMIQDVFIDFGGTLLGVLVFFAIHRRMQNRKQKLNNKV